MERRVKDRDKTDPLKVFWSGLLSNKENLAKWMIKMKARADGDRMSDETMLTMISEFKRELEEEKRSDDWYSFRHVEFDHPLLTRDQHLLIWEKHVQRSEKSKDIEGRLHIAKPPNFSNSHITQTGHESAVERSNACSTAAELEAATAKATDSRAAYMRNLEQERLRLKDVEDDADVEEINKTGVHLLDMQSSDRRTMLATQLAEKMAKDMKARELNQQRQDEDDMNDASLRASDRLC
jgi:hypothetical protein